MMSRRQARKIAQRRAANVLAMHRWAERAELAGLADDDRELVMDEYQRTTEWLAKLGR